MVCQNPRFCHYSYINVQESGLYYLQSRYYDPALRRWINADSVVPETGGDIYDYNMYAYDISFRVQTFCLYESPSINFFITKKLPLDSIVYYDVPLYYQNGYSLCWAFCQVMVEDYQAGITRTNEQATESAISIARIVHGDDWNQGGRPTNESYSLPYTDITSLDDLYNMLVENGPIYALYFGTSGGHIVVITGVNKTKGIIYTNNPWGVAGEQTYSGFLKGFVDMPIEWHMPLNSYIFT